MCFLMLLFIQILFQQSWQFQLDTCHLQCIKSIKGNALSHLWKIFQEQKRKKLVPSSLFFIHLHAAKQTAPLPGSNYCLPLGGQQLAVIDHLQTAPKPVLPPRGNSWPQSWQPSDPPSLPIPLHSLAPPFSFLSPHNHTEEEEEGGDELKFGLCWSGGKPLTW